jgi:uncharacterized protein YjbI with pentapeptide repeats
LPSSTNKSLTVFKIQNLIKTKENLTMKKVTTTTISALVVTLASISAQAATCTSGANTCVVTPPPGDIVGAVYEKMDLTGRDLSTICSVIKTVNGVTTKVSTFLGVSFDDSTLDGLTLTNCDVTGGRARIKLSAIALQAPTAILTKFKMPYANLKGANLVKAISNGGFDLYYAQM